MGRMPDQQGSRETALPDGRGGILKFPSHAPDVPEPPGETGGDVTEYASGEEALDALHARFHEALVAYARAYVSREDAEDITQGAFAALWERYLRHPRLEWPRNLPGFLVNAVRWRVMDFRRNRKSLRAILARAGAELGRVRRRWMEADGELTDDRLSRALEAARQEMPPRAREIHVMHFTAGFSIAEIMEATGVSRGTVSALLTRANRIVRRHLELAGYAPEVRRALGAGRKG